MNALSALLSYAHAFWARFTVALALLPFYPQVQPAEVTLLNDVFAELMLCVITLAFIVLAVRTRLSLRIPFYILSARLLVETTEALFPDAGVAQLLRGVARHALHPF